MPSNKNPLKNAKLYLILDTQVISPQRLLIVLKDAVRFGIDIVQLRNKFSSTREMLGLCKEIKRIVKHKSLFIVNDRVDLAILAKADGVHLGQEDIPYAQARQMMGPKAIIGVSCQSLAHALKAKRDGADYIGFGSVFKTKTKPERSPMDLKVLRQVWQKVDIPIFPIGGISRANIDVLTDLGINRAAVCRDILLAKEPGQSVAAFKTLLDLKEN